MDALELARWQFAITTVFHFFFVPVSIGMGLIGLSARHSVRARWRALALLGAHFVESRSAAPGASRGRGRAHACLREVGARTRSNYG